MCPDPSIGRRAHFAECQPDELLQRLARRVEGLGAGRGVRSEPAHVDRAAPLRSVAGVLAAVARGPVLRLRDVSGSRHAGPEACVAVGTVHAVAAAALAARVPAGPPAAVRMVERADGDRAGRLREDRELLLGEHPRGVPAAAYNKNSTL